MDSELESLAGSSSDEESDKEWSDIEEELRRVLMTDYDKFYIEETDVTMMIHLMPTLDVLEPL